MLPVDPDHVKLPPKNLSQLRCTKLQLAAWADHRPYAEQSQLVPTNPSGGWPTFPLGWEMWELSASRID